MTSSIKVVPGSDGTEDPRFAKKRLEGAVNRFTLLRRSEFCVRQEMVLNSKALFNALKQLAAVMQTVAADSTARALSGYCQGHIPQNVSAESAWVQERMLSNSDQVEASIVEAMRLVLSCDVTTADQLGAVLASLEEVDGDDPNGS